MIKKLFIMLSILLSAFIAQAQEMTGQWYFYPTYTGTVSSMVEGGEKVYFVSQGCLFSYDTTTNELYSYTKQNLLNDTGISNIYYNHDEDYLMVTYSNCNIDIVYEDGRVVNMSDIKDAVVNVTTGKTVNDVAFYKGKIYVATSFGMVVFDSQKHYVVESGIYYMNMKLISVWKDHIFARIDNDIWISPVKANHYNISSFRNDGHFVLDQFLNIGDDDRSLYAVSTSNGIYRIVAGNDFVFQYVTTIQAGKMAKGWVGSDGHLYVPDATSANLYKIKDDKLVSSTTLPSALAGLKLTSYKNGNRLWAASKLEGVGLYDISSGSATPVVSPVSPQGTSTVEKVGFITPGWDFSRIYVNNQGITHYKKNVDFNSDGHGDMISIDLIEDGTIMDVNADEVTAKFGVTKYRRDNNFAGDTRILAPYNVAEDRFDPSILYVVGGTEGVYKIQNGKQIGIYNDDNSKMVTQGNSYGTWGGILARSVCVDNNGNLWVVYFNPGDKGVRVDILPYDKVKLPTDQVTAADWKSLDDPDLLGNQYNRDNNFLVCRHSNMVFMLHGFYGTNLLAYDTKGTASLADDKYLVHTGQLTDQDGKGMTLEQKLVMVEDNEGKVWVAGVGGIFEITVPTDATSPSMTVNHLKVPRNDGTNFADYLLDTEHVTCMTVDPSNRKWIGTMESGIYLVSPRGDEVLMHYTTNDSQLPDNKINDIYADPLSNKVYIGTNSGLCYFNSTSGPSSDDYESVYAFPNPVRPDYTGWVTVKNLMDNSLVKITDAQGNTLCNGNSEGGVFMWDVCDSAGNRVRSGVYYVYASTSSGGSTAGKPVTKILVVN